MPDNIEQTTETPPQSGTQPQAFIFARELSEIYLLLDHISGRTDKTLPDDPAIFTKQSNLSASDNLVDPKAYPQFIEEICTIGWPPSGNAVARAHQAATLLRAKDRLNRAASPANGATVAFSLLVTGGDNDGGLNSRRCDGGSPAGLGLWNEPPSRLSLARIAFPGLVDSARMFRKWIRRAIYAMLGWLLLTCVLSWNIAMGHAILARLDTLHLLQTDIMAKISAADLEDERGSRRQQSAQGDAAQGNSYVQPYCIRQSKDDQDPAKQYKSIAALRVCQPLDQNTLAQRVTYSNLADWLEAWSFLKVLPHFFCGGPCLKKGADEAELTPNAIDEQWASILVEVLGGAMLPVCYGILGAGAAIVRDLWRKVRDSLLSPRDLTLSLAQLALGAVIGACIGLFVTPSGGSNSGTPALTSAVTLSASALSFIAGFGVEGVFVALEVFIKRVFNLK